MAGRMTTRISGARRPRNSRTCPAHAAMRAPQRSGPSAPRVGTASWISVSSARRTSPGVAGRWGCTTSAAGNGAGCGTSSAAGRSRARRRANSASRLSCSGSGGGGSGRRRADAGAAGPWAAVARALALARLVHSRASALRTRDRVACSIAYRNRRASDVMRRRRSRAAAFISRRARREAGPAWTAAKIEAMICSPRSRVVSSMSARRRSVKSWKRSSRESRGWAGGLDTFLSLRMRVAAGVRLQRSGTAAYQGPRKLSQAKAASRPRGSATGNIGSRQRTPCGVEVVASDGEVVRPVGRADGRLHAERGGSVTCA
jgi:hypothetical protein